MALALIFLEESQSIHPPILITADLETFNPLEDK